VTDKPHKTVHIIIIRAKARSNGCQQMDTNPSRASVSGAEPHGPRQEDRAPICDKCSFALSHEPRLNRVPAEERYRHHEDTQSLMASAANGCRLCSVAARTLQSWFREGSPLLPALAKGGGAYSCSHFMDTSLGERFFSIYANVPPSELLANLSTSVICLFVLETGDSSTPLSGSG
jgi:hypothetical protein